MEKLALVGSRGRRDSGRRPLGGHEEAGSLLARDESEDHAHDELTTGLDLITADVINRLIRRLQKDSG